MSSRLTDSHVKVRKAISALRSTVNKAQMAWMGRSNTSPVPDDSGVQLRGVDVNNVEGGTDRQLPQQGQGVAVDHGEHTCVWGVQIALVKTTARTGLSNDTFDCEGARNIQIHLHKPTTRLYPTHTLTYMHACRCAHAHTQALTHIHSAIPVIWHTDCHSGSCEVHLFMRSPEYVCAEEK